MDQFIIKHVEVKTLLNYSVGESYRFHLLYKENLDEFSNSYNYKD